MNEINESLRDKEISCESEIQSELRMKIVNAIFAIYLFETRQRQAEACRPFESKHLCCSYRQRILIPGQTSATSTVETSGVLHCACLDALRQVMSYSGKALLQRSVSCN